MDVYASRTSPQPVRGEDTVGHNIYIVKELYCTTTLHLNSEGTRKIFIYKARVAVLEHTKR